MDRRGEGSARLRAMSYESTPSQINPRCNSSTGLEWKCLTVTAWSMVPDGRKRSWPEAGTASLTPVEIMQTSVEQPTSCVKCRFLMIQERLEPSGTPQNQQTVTSMECSPLGRYKKVVGIAVVNYRPCRHGSDLSRTSYSIWVN